MATPLLESGRTTPYTGATSGTVRRDEPPDASGQGEWSVAKRVGFRLLFTYLVLYNLPFPIGALPLTESASNAYNAIWKVIVPWFGAHVLHLAKPITIFPSGSGDKTFDYVQLLLFVILAVGATAVWSALDRRRRSYPQLAAALRVYVRYVLAFALLSYGAFKVIKTQFPDNPPSRLIEPFGDFSPMGVVWAWMGASYAYNVFAGLAEMVSGALLFSRRTTTLGALCAFAVLSNIVMINFAYDVPVKQYSSHLLLMAVFLAAPDFGRLVRFFVLNRGVPPADPGGIRIPDGRVRALVAVAKGLFIAVGVISPLHLSWQAGRVYGANATRPPLYGIWDVDLFVRGRDTLPALVGDTLRWRRFVVNYPGYLSVRLLNDSTRGFAATVDTIAHTLELKSRSDSARVMPFAYGRSGDRLRLDGLLGQDSLHIRLHRVDEKKFLLVSRGFHWINELPFNR